MKAVYANDFANRNRAGWPYEDSFPQRYVGARDAFPFLPHSFSEVPLPIPDHPITFSFPIERP